MKLKIRILFAGLILLSIKWKPFTDEYSKQKMTQLFTSLSNEVSGFEELEVREIKSDRFDVAFFLTFKARIFRN